MSEETTYRPRMADAIRIGAQEATGRIRVSVDAEVISYDPDTCSATMQPVVHERVMTSEGEVWADEIQIPNCPVRWPGGGGVSLTWPLPVGAICPLMFRDRSHEEVDAGATVPTKPESTRRWDLSDAFVLPFAYSARDLLPTNATSSGDDCVIHLPTNRSVLVGASTAAKALAIAEDTARELAQIQNFLNTATYAVAGAVTVAPSPAPFTGAPVTAPFVVASVTTTPVAATTTADIQTTRIKTDV